jgi:hypothetical protein
MRKPATFVERSTLNIEHSTFNFDHASRQVGAFTYFGAKKNNFVKSGATGFDVGTILVQRPLDEVRQGSSLRNVSA